MTASASFTVDGVAIPGTFTYATGATVSLALASTSGVNSVSWSIIGNDNSARTNPTITAAGTPSGATATFTMPADGADGLGQCYLVQCVVNGGKDANGNTVSAYTAQAVIGVENIGYQLPAAYGETVERDASLGWTELANQTLAGSPNSYAQAQTTDATTTTVITIPMDADETCRFGVSWRGIVHGGGNEAAREALFTYRRVGAAAPAQWGTDNDSFGASGTYDDATWGAMDHAVSSNNVIIRVAGKAATTIDWDVAVWKRRLSRL